MKTLGPVPPPTSWCSLITLTFDHDGKVGSRKLVYHIAALAFKEENRKKNILSWLVTWWPLSEKSIFVGKIFSQNYQYFFSFLSCPPSPLPASSVSWAEFPPKLFKPPLKWWNTLFSLLNASGCFLNLDKSVENTALDGSTNLEWKIVWSAL